MSESVESVPAAASVGAPASQVPKACSLCAETIGAVWYRSGGLTFCPSCHAAAATGQGTPAGRFLRALVLGAAAAALSGAAWYGVIVWTGQKFGLLAILVGLFVGGAVRYGGYRHGGWSYQALAVFLTYSAIAISFAPRILQAATEAPGEAASLDAALAGDPGAAPSGTVATALAAESPPPSPAGSAASGEELAPAGPAGALLGLAASAGIVFAFPFLMGLENFLGWLILAFALYEAWKLNRREALLFEGPLHPPGHRPGYVPEPSPPPISP